MPTIIAKPLEATTTFIDGIDNVRNSFSSKNEKVMSPSAVGLYSLTNTTIVIMVQCLLCYWHRDAPSVWFLLGFLSVPGNWRGCSLFDARTSFAALNDVRASNKEQPIVWLLLPSPAKSNKKSRNAWQSLECSPPGIAVSLLANNSETKPSTDHRSA